MDDITGNIYVNIYNNAAYNLNVLYVLNMQMSATYNVLRGFIGSIPRCFAYNKRRCCG